jgi:hypothetical protein
MLLLLLMWLLLLLLLLMADSDSGDVGTSAWKLAGEMDLAE